MGLLLKYTFLFVALVACSPSAPEEQVASPDLAQAWKQGLPQLQQAVQELAPSERWIALQALMNKLPETATAPLCDWIPPDARERCQSTQAKIKGRPHLWGRAGPKQPKKHPRASDPQQRRPSKLKRTASGPTKSFVVLPKNLPFPFAHLSPVSGQCTNQDPLCHQRLALKALRRNKVDESAAFCLQDSEMWQSECFFRMGEEQSKRTVNNLSKGDFSEAFRFCLAAGKFMPDCVQQSIIIHSLGAPAANDFNSQSWANVRAHASALNTAVLDIPKAFRQEILERYWSSLLLVSTQKAGTIRGTAQNQLPQMTRRHLRAAAAYQSVALQENTKKDWGADSAALARLGRELLMQMEQRSSPVPSPGKTKNANLQDFWSEDAQGDQDIPSTMYLGTSRRTWSPDPLLDAQICILEALARHRLGKDLLQASTEHPNAQIAWTAKRLIQAEKNRRRHKPNAP
jgi:hypothetical protein